MWTREHISALIFSMMLVLTPSLSTEARGEDHRDTSPTLFSGVTSGRTVLAELFTGTWCPPCVFADEAMHILGTEFSRDDLAIVEWHMSYGGMSDPYEPTDGSTAARVNYYGEEGAPLAIFDGDRKNLVAGAHNTSEVYQKYRMQIASHLNTSSPLTIAQSGEVVGTTGNVDITLIVTGQVSGTYALRVILVEHIGKVYQGHRVDYVARALVHQENIDLTPGTSVRRSTSFSINASWDVQEMYSLAVVQDDTDKHVLQASETPLNRGRDTDPPAISGLAHTPQHPTELQSVNVSCTVTDGTGVSAAWLIYDDGTETNVTMRAQGNGLHWAEIGPFPAGIQVGYHVVAMDTSGNVGSSGQRSFTVLSAPVDDTPPQISTIGVSPSAPAAGDDVTLTAVITDDHTVSSARVLYDTAAGSGYSREMNRVSGDTYMAHLSTLPAGRVTYTIRAEDTSGNRAERSGAFDVSIPPRPDMAIAGVSVSPERPDPTSEVVCRVVLVNRGDVRASNVTLTIDVNGLLEETRTPAPFAPGEQRGLDIPLGPFLSGNHTLTVRVSSPEDADPVNDVMHIAFQVYPEEGDEPASGRTLMFILFAVSVVIIAPLLVLAARRGRKRYPGHYR